MLLEDPAQYQPHDKSYGEDTNSGSYLIKDDTVNQWNLERCTSNVIVQIHQPTS